MTLLRRLAFLLILTTLATSCVGPCAGETTPPAPISPPPVAREKPAPVAPPAAEPGRDIAALIRDLQSEDDAVVLAAGKQLEWRSLTSAEMARLVPLLWKAFLADPDGDVDWEELRSFVGSAEVPSLLASLPKHMNPGHAEWIAGGLHRMMRAEHLPVVAAKFLEMEDPAYRNAFTWDLFGLPLEYTDRHRELAARTLLRHSMPAGRPVWEEPTASGPGYPPLLETVLRRFVTEGAACPFPFAWIGRWMSAERPGPKDAALLLAVLEHPEGSQLSQPAERALGFLSDPETLEALGVSVVAEGARARRGDEAALKSLRADAGSEPEALAVLLDVAPDVAMADLEKLVFSGTRDGDRALHALRAVLVYERYWFGTKIDDAWFAGFREHPRRGQLTGHQFALLGAIVPGCRTREIAARACELMMERPPPAEFFEDDEALAFLEVGAPPAFLATLRRHARSTDDGVRNGARRALLRLGDPESTDLLVGHLEEATLESGDAIRLARCGGAAVEAYLRKKDETAALAVFYGLPESVAWAFDEAPAESRKLVRDGRPVDALLLHLEQEPDATLWGIGRVRDERIRAWLERQRALRRNYPWATGELMLAGDPAARRETWAALTTGRYRWVDEADTEILTLDHDLSTIPHWLSDLESNCCRFNVVAAIFDDLFGLDLDDYRNSPVVTPAAVAREFWARHGKNLVWSRIAGHFVPGAR